MNVLDPVILAGGGPAAGRQLLSAVAELAGDGPLDEWHQAALEPGVPGHHDASSRTSGGCR